MKQKYIVAQVSEIPPGSRKLVEVRRRKIVIFNIDGEFYGLFNACPHLGGSLCEGYLTGFVKSKKPGEYSYEAPGQVLRCPWHGWEFDIKTGKSYFSPQTVMARTADVDVASGVELQEGPYTAETVSVTLEENYVVLHV